MRNCAHLVFTMILLGAIALITGSIDSVFAQPPAPPVGPTAPIPWGDPFLYTAIIFGYGLYKLKRKQ